MIEDILEQPNSFFCGGMANVLPRTLWRLVISIEFCILSRRRERFLASFKIYRPRNAFLSWSGNMCLSNILLCRASYGSSTSFPVTKSLFWCHFPTSLHLLRSVLVGGFTLEMTPQDCVYNVIRRVQSTTQKSVQSISQGLRGFCATQSLSVY